MRIEQAVRRRRPLSLTSLIDVIFLLLLFFMLSSTFTRFAEVEITGGRATTASAAERPDVLIRLSTEGWQVNGVTFGEEDAIPELSRLHEAGAESAVVLVRGADVTSQMLVGAVERIRRETQLTLSVAR
ncbi:MAG: biopolymer transporter ExbD [Aliihoeflea sp.]